MQKKGKLRAKAKSALDEQPMVHQFYVCGWESVCPEEYHDRKKYSVNMPQGWFVQEAELYLDVTVLTIVKFERIFRNEG